MFAGINGPPGALISRSGELTFEGFCAHCSAPFITNTITGKQLGVYIDDMTPDRLKWCDIALLHHPLPQHVFVGIGPDETHTDLKNPDTGIPTDVTAPTLIRLKEHLPWGNSNDNGKTIIPWREWPKVPKCQDGGGYILQMFWKGPYGKHPPNETCKKVQLHQALQHEPKWMFFI